MELKLPYSIITPAIEIIKADENLIKGVESVLNCSFNELQQQERVTNEAIYGILGFLKQQGVVDVGVRIGRSIPMGALGTLDYYISCCNTLGEAMVGLVHYFPTFGFLVGAPELTHTSSDEIQFEFRLSAEDEDSIAPTRDSVVTGFFHLINRLTQGELWPTRLVLPKRFFHKELVHAFQAIAAMEIEWGDNYQIYYPKNVLKLTLPFANPKLASTLKLELDDELLQTQRSETIVDQVFKLFSSNQDFISLSQSFIAKQLHMSESSLKRALSQEGTSFSNMLASFKKDFALKSVLDSGQKIEVVAHDLGYSDRASFERAFKGWFKFTPMQFRKMTQLIAIDAKKVRSDDIFGLPASSQTCQQVMQILHKENFHMDELVEAISRDPILTGKLIGIANSAFYGGREVSDIKTAVTQSLGVDMVQNLAVSMMASVELTTDKCPAFNLVSYWMQALVSAEFAKMFVQCDVVANEKESRYLVLAALMHNIGGYALVYLRPEQSNQFLELLMGSSAAYHMKQQIALQHKVFSVSSFKVAGLLMNHWGLPADLCLLVSQQEEVIMEKGKTLETAKVLAYITDYVRQLSRPKMEPERISDRLDKLAGLIGKDKALIEERSMDIIKRLPEFEALARQITKDVNIDGR